MKTSEVPGLIGWWPLDDADGRLTDRLGQSNGVVTGAEPRTHLQSDRLGPSRSLFFQRGAYATIPNAPNVGTGDFSFCLWAKKNSHSRDVEVLLDKRMEDSGPVRGWSIFLANGQLRFQIADGNWLNFVLVTSGRQAEVDGNWHHLAITIDRDQTAGGRWYIDGQAVGSPFSVTHHAGSLSNEFPLTLGRRSDAGGGFFGGDLSDVRLYERALTAEEIYQVYGSSTVDEQASRVLVTLPGVSATARSIESSEPRPLPDGAPLVAARLEAERVAALSEVTQPVQIDPESGSAASVTLGCAMLPNCQTCQFHSPPRHAAIEIGCAVNPRYWSQWQRARSLGRERPDSVSPLTCRDYKAIRTTAEKLIGLWDYQVSIAKSCYRLQIFAEDNGELIGRYLIPSNDDSRFEIRVYESSERGRPVLSIAQNHYSRHRSSPSYHAVLTGRLDQDDLITGSFVDLDNNRGTFRMKRVN